METIRLCPQCRQPLAADAPAGLCPACLLQRALDSGTRPPDSPSAREPSEPATGTKLGYIGDYELLSEVARGGMGVVYKARQSSLKRIVAVKMIRSGELAGDAEVKRFRAEAEAAANLQHPNIVAIHEIGEHDGRHYFSMDFVEGKNLAQLSAGQPVPAKQAAEWLKAIAEAVQFAHQRGVLHRDLKPQNILVDAAGQPRVTDFGLAKNLHADSSVTQSGAVMGSPSYMAPEQARGRNDLVGPASDVYSLGAVLYELLTGQPPFTAETPLQTLQKVVSEEPIRPSKLNPNAPPDLETICLKCLEKDVTRRYPTARALAEDLARFLRDEPIQARPPSPVRKVLFWLRRHPWAVTGLFSFLLLAALGLAYGLWEESAMLHWKAANGAKQRFTANDFFSDKVSFRLFFEFFLIQSLPWVLFSRKMAKQGLGRKGLWFAAVVGLAQILFGLWVGDTGLRFEIWVGRFGFSPVLWGASAFSNVWFGSTLVWKSLQHLRDLRLQGGEKIHPTSPAPYAKLASAEPVKSSIARPTVVVTRPKLLAALVAVEVAVFMAIPLFYPKLTLTPDVDGFFKVFWGLAFTAMILTSVCVFRSKGVARTIFLPLFVLSGLVVLTGLAGHISRGTPTPILAFSFLVGLGTGWLALRWKCLEGGEAPRFGSRQFWRQLVTGVAAVVGLVALVKGVENWRGRREWNRVKAELTAKGENLDYASYLKPPVPDAENVMAHPFMKKYFIKGATNVPIAHPPYAKNLLASTPYSLAEFSLAELKKLPRQANSKSSAKDAQPSLQEVLDWYARYQSEFGQLEEALQRPYSRLPHNPHELQPLLQPDSNYAAFRTAAQACVNLAKVHLLTGDAEAAMRNLRMLRRIMDASQATEPPTLSSALRRASFAGLLANTIEETLADGLWPTSYCGQIQALTGKHDMLDVYVRAWRGGERAATLKWIDSAAESDSVGLLVSLEKDAPASHHWIVRLEKLILPRGWYDQNKATYARLCQLHLAGIDLNSQRIDVAAVKAAAQNAQLETDNISIYSIMVSLNIWMESSWSTPAFFSKNVTKMNMAQVACALERHRAAKGNYPETLAALVPEFAAKLPHDLFDGQPLRYRRTDSGGYLLYSIGWNSKDDGGSITLDKNQQPEWNTEKGDWVWQGVPRHAKSPTQ